MLKHERAVVVAVVVDLEHVADEVADAVAHPRFGDDLLPRPWRCRAGRRSSPAAPRWRRQSAIEYSPWAPATSSSEWAPPASGIAFATSALESRASWYWPRM